MVITIIKIQLNILNNLTEITSEQSDCPFFSYISFNSFNSLFSNLDPDRLTPGQLKEEGTFESGVPVHPVPDEGPQQQHRAGHHQPVHGCEQKAIAVQLHQEHSNGEVPHSVALEN